MSPIDLDRLLARFAPDRRSFLKTLALGTAYATPLVASFSMDGLGVDAAAAQASNLCSNLVSNTADLVITKTASPEPVTAGTDLTYTLTVYNCGPATANSVQFADFLPAGATFVSATHVSGPLFTLTTPPVGTEGGLVEGSAATMAPGATSVFSIVVKVKP